MKNRTLYCGAGDFVVKVNECDIFSTRLIMNAEYVFFKNEDGEYEFIKSRHGDRSFMFLSLDDVKKYLSLTRGSEITMLKIVKSSPERYEHFCKLLRGR